MEPLHILFPKAPSGVRIFFKMVKLLLTDEKVTTKHFNVKLHHNKLPILKAMVITLTILMRVRQIVKPVFKQHTHWGFPRVAIIFLCNNIFNKA